MPDGIVITRKRMTETKLYLAFCLQRSIQTKQTITSINVDTRYIDVWLDVKKKKIKIKREWFHIFCTIFHAYFVRCHLSKLQWLVYTVQSLCVCIRSHTSVVLANTKHFSVLYYVFKKTIFFCCKVHIFWCTVKTIGVGRSVRFSANAYTNGQICPLERRLCVALYNRFFLFLNDNVAFFRTTFTVTQYVDFVKSHSATSRPSTPWRENGWSTCTCLRRLCPPPPPPTTVGLPAWYDRSVTYFIY